MAIYNNERDPNEIMWEKQNEILKTSEEWQRELPYPKVLDPDGWDRKNFRYSWHEEKISSIEYMSRIMVSTCMFKREKND